MIEFACGCGNLVSADDSLAGRKGRCKACGAVNVIPQAVEPAPLADAERSPRRRPILVPVLAGSLVLALAGLAVALVAAQRAGVRGRAATAELETMRAERRRKEETREAALARLAVRRADDEAARLDEGERRLRQEDADSRLRLISAMVRDYGLERMPRGVEILGSQRTDDRGGWVFLVRDLRDDCLPGQVWAVVVEDGRVIKEFRDESDYYWAAFDPDQLTLWYASKRLPYEHNLKVVKAELPSPHVLDAVVQDRATAQRWKLTVNERGSCEVVAIDE